MRAIDTEPSRRGKGEVRRWRPAIGSSWASSSCHFSVTPFAFLRCCQDIAGARREKGNASGRESPPRVRVPRHSLPAVCKSDARFIRKGDSSHNGFLLVEGIPGGVQMPGEYPVPGRTRWPAGRRGCEGREETSLVPTREFCGPVSFHRRLAASLTYTSGPRGAKGQIAFMRNDRCSAAR